MKTMTYEQLQQHCQQKGYAFFDEGDYNLNLIGVRSHDTHANTFNDRFYCAYRVNGQPVVMSFACTTDPGIYWRQHPMHVDGVAILVPGQYRNLWQLGMHKNQYTALVQLSEVPLYRDNNGDASLDQGGAIYRGFFGIHCHRASQKTQEDDVVNRWSAGCQVIANQREFELFIALCQLSADRYGNRFTYTLIEESDLWNR